MVVTDRAHVGGNGRNVNSSKPVELVSETMTRDRRITLCHVAKGSRCASLRVKARRGASMPASLSPMR